MTYFPTSGLANTQATADLALAAAEERDIRYILVASNHGETAKRCLNDRGIQIICVTRVHGSPEVGRSEMPAEVRRELTDLGITLLTATHVLSGAERGISRVFGGTYPVEIIAHTLRLLSQGVKVGVEIAVMALDAGLIPYGEPVVAIGGTGRGADTAIVVTPSHASSIFDTKINEIICKPSYYKEREV